MGAKRFFVAPPVGEYVSLTGEEYTHARVVLRVEVGEEVVLLDGSGKEYDGVVSAINKKDLTVHVLSSRVGDKEPNVGIKLLFGYLKNADKNEFVVQKATELGASEVVLFSSQFSSAYVNENKIERLKKVAQESAKQCLRSKAPEISYYPTLDEALASGTGCQNKIFACEFTDRSDIDLSALQGSTAIVVGSEGGFSKEEFERAQALGYKGVTLGKRILRAETAAVALTSVVAFSVGELR